jgi:hypothetical protein
MHHGAQSAPYDIFNFTFEMEYSNEFIEEHDHVTRNYRILRQLLGV